MAFADGSLDLTVLPVIILFFFTQRTFLRGLTFLKTWM